jgi:hypothetical protein
MFDAKTSQQCLQFPTLSSGNALAVLSVLAQADFAGLVQSELRVGKVSDATWRMFLPVRPQAMQGGENAVRAFRDTLKAAYKTEADFEVGREADQGFAVSTHGLMHPFDAAIMLALQVDAQVGELREPAPPSDEKMLVVLGPDKSVQTVVADIVRQGRDVRLGGVQSRSAQKSVGVVLFTDDAADYGMASAHLRRDDLGVSTYSMVPHGLGFIRLWIEESVLVGDGQGRKALTKIMVAAKGSDVLRDDVSDVVVIKASSTRFEILIHCKDTTISAPTAAETVAPTLDPVQPFDVTRIEFRPDTEAAAALAQAIVSMRRPVGYRVALQPLPRGVAPGVDIEPLLENIADLQLQVDQITALGAPQQRLMRFTDGQLPCMIDGLRRLPPEKLTDGTLRYAASHSAGRGEPAHYLIYDPQFTFMRIAESHWRTQSDQHPMSYWLEPFVADAQLKRPSKTQVFVPAGHFMVPSMAHFGGNIDETLRLVLGNLFDAKQPLLTDPARSAFYVFSPSPAEEFRLELEVVDGDAFAPLHQQLNWINDYLQVRSPVAVDHERLADVASGLYEGSNAKVLKKDMDADLKELDGEWSTAQSKVEAEARQAINVVGDEMDAVSARIADLHSYLAQANREMLALEQVAVSASAALQGLDAIGDDLSLKDRQMARTRDDFESRVEAEVTLAGELIEKTQARVELLRGRIERIRNWGDT